MSPTGDSRGFLVSVLASGGSWLCVRGPACDAGSRPGVRRRRTAPRADFAPLPGLPQQPAQDGGTRTGRPGGAAHGPRPGDLGEGRPQAARGYEFSIRLARDRNEHVEGLREPHDLELLIDRERIETFTVEPPDLMSDVALNYQPSQDDVDDHLVIRAPVTAWARAIRQAGRVSSSAGRGARPARTAVRGRS